MRTVLESEARARTNATQFFPTPPDVITEILDLADVAAGHVVLEPSAGTGAIAAAAAKLVTAVDCVERESDFADAIRDAGYARNLTVGDFLAVPPDPVYDRVLMNPPFARGAGATHVLHALQFVKPGGRLVAVLPGGSEGQRNKKSLAIRDIVDRSYGRWEPLPAGAFRESGTPFSTVMVCIPVMDSGPRADSDTPLRVTPCHDVAGLRWFDPVTAAPGAYIHDNPGGRNRVYRFDGWCISCGRRTWAHDDGEDDVRGSFGVNTAMPIDYFELRYHITDPPAITRIPRCAACSGTRELNEQAISLAVAQVQAQREVVAEGPIPFETAAEENAPRRRRPSRNITATAAQMSLFDLDN